MTATASVSSPWIPEDDLLLKNSIEGGASLEALAKGAVKFSRRFTFREIRDRWYSLLYDPDVSAQASARMAELELSGSNPNPSSKFKLDNLKGTEKVLEKRKTGSIRKQYHSWRKRIKNEFFSSQNLGFYEERSLHNYNHPEHKFQDHVTTNHVAPGGDAMLDDCLANNLGFEEKDFEILRQAFPESIGSIATTATTTVIDNHNPNPFHMERCHKSVENDFINGREEEEEGDLFKFPEDISPSRNELIGSFDPIKNATCASETPPNLKTDKPESGFGGKHHFSSPVSDGSASFPLSFSSPSTRLPLWKTLEDVSAPDMPVDDNNAESHQVTEETLPPLPDDSDHIRENKTSPGVVVSLLGNRPNGFINSSGVHEGEYTDLPDSLLNLSNEDDILFMDVDVKDHMKDTMDDVPNQEVDLCNVDVIPGVQDDVASTSTSVSQIESVQLTEGQIICTLNREDPDIPCNDDIFLLIHPSTPFPPCIGQVATTDSMCPLSPSSHEKDEQGIITVRKGKDLTPPCFPRPSALPEFGSVFKREPSEVEYRAPLPVKPNNHLRIPGQTRSMQLHTPLEITRNGMVEEGGAKAELQGLGSPTLYNEMPLPLEVGSVKMIDPESMDDSNVSDQNNSDDDADIPYFSDVEAMILEMDLTHAQESCLASEVVRNEYEGSKKMIIRLEQAARSSFQRALSSQGALAIFYGRRLKHYIKKAEVTIGRSTDDTEVDIDLRKEGRANKISRRQAIIKMETDGSFSLKNLGASSISLNGKEVAHGQVVALSSTCLIEIRGMSFVFETNDKYVRRFLGKQRK
ncbi:uncharacterized protein LOC111913338 [Lactuca sativa]|uniref:FHA domain-containing protein n=1 Tax=Lactuca sativa TaxID=4236 RepID=A0A9R1XSB0_LACSA|nr:uncharacterized protein LOC111913338 [Lactuca sativa]KAJ0219919.1 hypothetical protein LSAT_V11C200078130 [Lactuca sativa]